MKMTIFLVGIMAKTTGYKKEISTTFEYNFI